MGYIYDYDFEDNLTLIPRKCCECSEESPAQCEEQTPPVVDEVEENLEESDE